MGEASSPYAAPAGHTIALTFIVRDTPESAERTAALICHQQHATVTGYLSTVPKEACRQAAAVATLLVTEPDSDRICTDIFGGPQTAEVRGLVDGQWIERSFSRRDGCEIADWDAMGVLLSGPVSTTDILVDYHRTGGIAGFDDRITVSSAGLATRTARGGPPETFQVAASDLHALEQALAAADFPSLPAKSLPRVPVADGFSYEITHLGKTAVTADGAVPAGLTELITVLDRLLSVDAAAVS
jgi:hypothetical protein